MLSVVIFFTFLVITILILQYINPKGGMWHRRRAFLLGILPIVPIFRHFVTVEYSPVLFSASGIWHISFGTLYYYFWMRTARSGIHAVKTAAPINAHRRYAIFMGVVLFAMFFLPLIIRRL